MLRITWDTLRKRWFYLPPPDVEREAAAGRRPALDRHRRSAGTTCAPIAIPRTCRRTTTWRRGTYRTTFSEIDVSCETCHGPASLHVELARSRSLFWDRKRGYGLAG